METILEKFSFKGSKVVFGKGPRIGWRDAAADWLQSKY